MKYKVGDKVRIKSIDWYNENNVNGDDILENIGIFPFFPYMARFCGQVLTIKDIRITYYTMEETDYYTCWTDEMIEGLVEEEVDLIPKFGEFSDNEPKDMGEVSDGYHTFNELYEYRLLYNASMFNELAKQNLYDVHKSKRHSDGEIPFGDSNWFIVMAELPTGQISNHYEMKDWDLFDIPEKETANEWDGHTPKDVAERLRRFLTPKPKYPKTYKECLSVLKIKGHDIVTYVPSWTEYEKALYQKVLKLRELIICRDAYWKLYGEEMVLGKPWESSDSDYITGRYCIFVNRGNIICDTPAQDCILTFQTEEMRDAFYENFKSEIESCKEFL